MPIAAQAALKGTFEELTNMKRLIAAAFAIAVLMPASTGMSLAADGPGTCGKGKVWNPDTQSCVAKPKQGGGSGSHSG